MYSVHYPLCSLHFCSVVAMLVERGIPVLGSGCSLIVFMTIIVYSVNLLMAVMPILIVFMVVHNGVCFLKQCQTFQKSSYMYSFPCGCY